MVPRTAPGRLQAQLRRAVKRLCPLCRQKIDRKSSVETYYRFLLHGGVRYGMCLECLLEVLPPWSDVYRLRYDLKVEVIRRSQAIAPVDPR